MKNHIPSNSGLTEKALHNIQRFFGNSPKLTDVQFKALEKGVGRGQSILVVSPTSTGKTQIGLWAIQSGLEKRLNAVYLVTHRALAKQKFEEFSEILGKQFVDLNNIILATGDTVIDGEGYSPSSPLSSGLVVATYEKYLALLSSSGIPDTLKNTVIVCDEVQLIGDKSRGEHVEILLTLLKNAGWSQLVALSAVLEEKDATELANWLGIESVFETQREKHLQYEYWSRSGIKKVTTDNSSIKNERLPIPSNSIDAGTILNHLIKDKNTKLPIIVFCLRKDDITFFAENYLNSKCANKSNTQLALDFEGLPLTVTNEFLSLAHSHRITIHSGDLTDEEKIIVEKKIINKEVDIVFATTTLAAGVNFPFGTAIFSSYARWNRDAGIHEPIDSAEFHNMAGRVGRMGLSEGYGRVIFCEHPRLGQNLKINYLDFASLPSIKPQIKIGDSERLLLQLITAGLCNSTESLINLLCNSYSGLWEEDNNLKSFESWPSVIKGNIKKLCEEGLLIETDKQELVATPIAKAIGNSGLRPSTATYILKYLSDKINHLTSLLPGKNNLGNLDEFSLLIFSACFSSPEFKNSNGKSGTRYMPWPLTTGDVYFDATTISDHLAEKDWFINVGATNSAKFALDWISGDSLYEMEKNIKSLRAGMLHENCRNLNWVLQGLSRILSVACKKNTHENALPPYLREREDIIEQLKKLPWHTRRLSERLLEGLPDDVLWFTEINKIDNRFKIYRNEILSFHEKGMFKPEQVCRGDEETDKVRLDVFNKVKPSPHAKANWLRDIVRTWKIQYRKKSCARHIKMSSSTDIHPYIQKYYHSLGNDFEMAFEELLNFLDIHYTRIDKKPKIGAPDYLLEIPNTEPIVMELKTKQGDNLVNYDAAVEVLAAAKIHGYGDYFCITLCHPGVDPSVASIIVDCSMLSVIESCDFVEGLIRYYMDDLSSSQLYDWLTIPGQALISDLPYKEY